MGLYIQSEKKIYRVTQSQGRPPSNQKPLQTSNATDGDTQLDESNVINKIKNIKRKTILRKYTKEKIKLHQYKKEEKQTE